MDQKIAAGVNVFAVVFSPDGKFLHGSCQDGKIHSWDTATAALAKSFTYDKDDSPGELTATTAVSIAKDGTLKTWDLATGKIVKSVKPAGDRARGLSLGPNGGYFIGGPGTETRMRAIDEMGKETYNVPAGLGGLGAVAVSPDGKQIIAASYDADMRAWNARNGELLRLIDELPVSMFDAQFSPDGKWLAAAGADMTLYIYDTRTWRQTRALKGQPEMISALSFSPDGARIATGGFNSITLKRPTKVLIWDVKTGKPERQFDAAQRVTSVAFSPNAQWLAVATGTQTVDLRQLTA